MGQLTTHVLDIALGQPAAGLKIELYRIESGRTHLATTITNEDGRCQAPMLSGDTYLSGAYELVFLVGDYLAARHPVHRSRPFLDRVPVQFQIDASQDHYHVPLLLSPFGYSTYRGS
jgi:5-hydroxyisourate hydrolase